MDVTNYILFLLGQPLHAFDFDKLAGADGKAHRGAPGGRGRAVYHARRRGIASSCPNMTVIATPERAVALAGVMGGLETEVTEATTTVLLEAAAFDCAHTSRTSRNLGLISESSMRYGARGGRQTRWPSTPTWPPRLIAEGVGRQVCPAWWTVMAGRPSLSTWSSACRASAP